MKSLFLGPRGLRAGWRIVLFVVVAQLVVQSLFAVLHFRSAPTWQLRPFLTEELVSLAGLVVSAVVLGVALRQRPARFGVGEARRALPHFAEGALWGAGAIIVLVGILAATGAAHFAPNGGWARAISPTGLGWLAAFLLVGVVEEFLFRGYVLGAATQGLGFWPGAIVLSLFFGAAHFFGKPHESVLDGINVTLIGLWFCFAVRATGSLWFAMGFHAAFDYVVLYMLGAPNTGNGGMGLADALLRSAYSGPGWWTGGVCGPEASVLVPPLFALLAVALAARFPRRRHAFP